MSSQTKVRLGFIGAGWWATSNHMPVLEAREDVELVGVCRLGEEALEQVKEKFGFEYATEDYDELLTQCELGRVLRVVGEKWHIERHPLPHCLPLTLLVIRHTRCARRAALRQTFFFTTFGKANAIEFSTSAQKKAFRIVFLTTSKC